MRQKKDSTVNMVFDTTLAVERIVLPSMEAEETFKHWKRIAATALATKLIEENLMAHSSMYDVRGQYTYETFTVLVARPKGTLP